MFSQAAYVIHKREYKEKSALVSFLGAESGRFQAIVHGTKKPAKAALLQPFQQLEVVTTQAPKVNSLVTIRQIEASSVRFPLTGNSSICGLYINELVYRRMSAYLSGWFKTSDANVIAETIGR
jgi:DNA repair protein RecO (recombination protein O)